MVVHACSSNYLEGSDGRITWAQEVEVVVSQDHTTALQPGDSETSSEKQKTKKQLMNPCTLFIWML